MVYRRSGLPAIWAHLSFEVQFFFWIVERVLGVRLDGGNTVPGDRVLFVLMSVTLGEGFYRLCVLHTNRSGLTREIKKVTSTVLYGQGYDQR